MRQISASTVSWSANEKSLIASSIEPMSASGYRMPSSKDYPFLYGALKYDFCRREPFLGASWHKHASLSRIPSDRCREFPSAYQLSTGSPIHASMHDQMPTVTQSFQMSVAQAPHIPWY
jgi:hypothetical protein